MRCGNAVAADHCTGAARGLADWPMGEPLLAQKRCAASAENAPPPQGLRKNRPGRIGGVRALPRAPWPHWAALEMVTPARFERTTCPLGGDRSIQLSYGASSEIVTVGSWQLGLAANRGWRFTPLRKRLLGI